jgi:hypothetical protein
MNPCLQAHCMDVIAPLLGELFSETNDSSVAILLTYGTATITLPEEVGVVL